MFELVKTSLQTGLQPYILFLMTIGVFVGLIFGAIPGLTVNMAVVLVLPFTFYMTPIEGISTLLAVYTGGVSGGLVSAILLGIPGTPAAIATTLDGYPLVKKGRGHEALGFGIISSLIGGIIGWIFLVTLAPQLARVALAFGNFEYFALGVVALTIIISLAGDSLITGLIAGLLGILFGTVGMNPVDGVPRFVFGISALRGGLSLLPVLIGLYGISQILSTIEEASRYSSAIREIRGRLLPPFKEVIKHTLIFLKAGIIGTYVGFLPGVGAGSKSLLAYSFVMNTSKTPELFGKGHIEGVIASETANDAGCGGSLIPMLTFGIPGDGVTALLMGAMTIHGIQPGPLLFTRHEQLVYSIFAVFLLANFIQFFVFVPCLPFFMRILQVPKNILMPIILVFCVIGAYGMNHRLFDVWVLFGFGIIGYIMRKLKFPLMPVVLGVILGPIIETNLRRALMATGGSIIPLFTRPISLSLIILALILIVLMFIREINKIGITKK